MSIQSEARVSFFSQDDGCVVKLLINNFKESHQQISLSSLESFFKSTDSGVLPKKGGFVAKTKKGELMGVLLYKPYAACEIKIVNLSVYQCYQNHNINILLVKELKNLAKNLEREAITVEVKRSDVETMAFFTQQGFISRPAMLSSHRIFSLRVS